LYLAKQVGEEARWKEETKERKTNSMRAPALGRSEELGKKDGARVLVPSDVRSNHTAQSITQFLILL
jgi:hypothetical protein